MSRYDLNGKDVLEIGCGKGRITRDLAKHACHVVATDPDVVSVGVAQASISFRNIDFMVAAGGIPDMAGSSFDVVIYTLCFHHVPVAEMVDSLRKALPYLKRMASSSSSSQGIGVLREKLEELPKDKEIITYCKISLRGYEAQKILDAAGFENTKFMDGGIMAWPYPLKTAA